MELLREDIKLQRERERDRGEKSTGEQGENGETINYLLTLHSRRENRGKKIFFCHIVNETT